MAGQDELIYRIKFEVDDTSLKSVQDQVNAIQTEMAQAPAASPIKQIQIDSKQSVQSLVELQKQINEYRGELKALDQMRKIGLNLTEEQLTQEQQLKVSLKATSQEYNRATQSLASQAAANSAAATTYNELVARNKALSAELRNLPLDDTTGKLAELQAEYSRNNERLKEFDRTMGNHQRNVGNYERALQGVTIGTQKLGMAFRASGVGFAAQAFNQLSTSVRNFEPVADGISNVFTSIGASVTSVLARVKLLGGAFDLLRQGEFREAFAFIKEGFAGIDEEVKNAVATQIDLNEAQRQELVTLSRVQLSRAESNKTLAEAKLISQDLSLSIDDRISALREVMSGEETQSIAEQKFHEDRIARLNREKALAKDSREAEIAVNEAKAEAAQLEEQSFNRRKELLAQLNTLEKEQAALDLQVRADRIAGYQASAEAAISIGQSLFGETKALRVAEAIMDTYRGATSAFADTPGGIFAKSIAAAAAVAAGIANVKKILATKPGSKAGGGGGQTGAGMMPARASAGYGGGVSDTIAGAQSSFRPSMGLTPGGQQATSQIAALNAFANRGAPAISIEAKIDREGLALAVRDGEQQIRTESITY